MIYSKSLSRLVPETVEQGLDLHADAAGKVMPAASAAGEHTRRVYLARLPGSPPSKHSSFSGHVSRILKSKNVELKVNRSIIFYVKYASFFLICSVTVYSFFCFWCLYLRCQNVFSWAAPAGEIQKVLLKYCCWAHNVFGFMMRTVPGSSPARSVPGCVYTFIDCSLQCHSWRAEQTHFKAIIQMWI